MLGLAVVLLLIAFLAYFFGQGRVGDAAIDIAKFCFVIFIILLILSFVFNAISPAPYWGWPAHY